MAASTVSARAKMARTIRSLADEADRLSGIEQERAQDAEDRSQFDRLETYEERADELTEVGVELIDIALRLEELR